MLWRRRPVGMPLGVFFVHSLHFLQEYQIGTDSSQAFAQIVNRHAPLELRETLVNIVSYDV